MVETSQKLKLADIQIETLKRSMTHAQLTDKEIGQLPVDINTYESLGRMFLLKDSTEARKNLENKIKVCEEKINALEVSPLLLKMFQCISFTLSFFNLESREARHTWRKA